MKLTHVLGAAMVVGLACSHYDSSGRRVRTGSTRFDPNVRDHHHLVCDRCGTVRDVELDTTAIRLPPAVLDGFGVGRVDVVFRGRCSACRSAAS